MPGRIALKVSEGRMAGREFVFDAHDTFVFGRAPDCHIPMPPEDATVYRHHFLLEVNPPDAVLRDLGSLNGTWVNGVRHGGRTRASSPEDGARQHHAEVRLKHRDQIRVGDTALTVTIEGPAAREPARCPQCGREAPRNVGQGRHSGDLCDDCRPNAEADPAALLMQILQRAGTSLPTGAPAISGYVVERKLERGGCGAVYRARRQQDGQSVALKVMLARVRVDDKARAKFLREIDAMRALRHPHIVALLDHGSAGNAFYFVMELCNGGSVVDWLKRCGGKLSVAQAGPVMLQALEGLAHAHHQGFVHRDLKPGNLLLVGTRSTASHSPERVRDTVESVPTGRWIAKIGDFGMAKSFQQAGLSGMTVTGDCAGTPVFMPREQVVNFRQVKPVSDVWSLGATFYCMLTGRGPRDFPPGVDPMEVVLGGQAIPIRQRDATLSQKLAAVIDRSLAVKPQDRFQDAGEFRRALEKALSASAR